MIESVVLVLSAILVIGAFGAILIGYRNYSRDQREAAGRLWTAYFSLNLAEAVIGGFVFVWVSTRGLPSEWLLPLLPLMLLPSSIVQWRMHRRMGYTPWLYRTFSLPAT